MKPRIPLVLAAVGMPLALSACGDTAQDRALSGAGIGAAGGAVLGAVTPVGPVGGALLGGAVGGATGALTSPSQANFGKPVWREGFPVFGTELIRCTASLRRLRFSSLSSQTDG